MTGSGRHVALLRGINVGGKNKLTMPNLRAIAASLGWQETASYIASGNLIFTAQGSSNALAKALKQGIQDEQNLNVSVVVQEAEAFRATLAACPFAPEEPRQAHIFWMFGSPDFDSGLCDELRADSEELVVADRAAYLLAPEGIGRSRLAARMERVLGGPITGRNLRTAQAISALLD